MLTRRTPLALTALTALTVLAIPAVVLAIPAVLVTPALVLQRRQLHTVPWWYGPRRRVLVTGARSAQRDIALFGRAAAAGEQDTQTQ